MKKIVEETKKQGKLLYISAYPCPECEQFEAALEELGANSDQIIKLDVPPDNWAIEYVLEQLRVSGSPSVITPDGRTIDDFDPIELAKKVAQAIKK